MRYIICGYPPGEGGVPKLIEYIKNNQKDKVKLIHPLSFQLGFKIPDLLIRALFRLAFSIRCLLIRNKKICLVHHQSIGLDLTKLLITKNNIDPIIYFMDNSFFCLSSYNLRKESSSNFGKRECLKCLEGNFQNAIVDNCKTNTFSISNNYRITKFLKWLRDYKGKVRFLSLSKTNMTLVKKHFGDKDVRKIYFLTEDIKPIKIIQEKISEHSYDYVYHGSALEAKGFKYFIELAKIMSANTFFLPSKINMPSIPKNLICENMRWDTGLKEKVQSAKIVFTPSLWSYTPEAASLKSFYFNGVVAMIDSDYGFNNEIPGHAYIKLTGDIYKDKEILMKLSSKDLEKIRHDGKEFYKKYFKIAEKDMSNFLEDKV